MWANGALGRSVSVVCSGVFERGNPRAYIGHDRGPITQDCNGLPLRSEMLPAFFPADRQQTAATDEELLDDPRGLA